jgi:putative intracellular protease/amidase
MKIGINSVTQLGKRKRLIGMIKCIVLVAVFSCCTQSAISQTPTRTILMFVSHEETYYSEYIVALKALQASGYTVDVRSATSDSASTYMLPANTDIAATAATLPGGSYLQFTQLYQNLFDSAWNPSWNATPSMIPVNGRIQDIVNMTGYDALVIPGGTGATAYRVDGTYSSQGTGPRQIAAGVVQAVALKLNALAIEALQTGKPVLAQCHAAALPAFWRIPGTVGAGIDSIGFSLLRTQYATGFPEPQTGITLSSLSVNHRTDDRVTISSPHSSLANAVNGTHKIITSRDWYPQTVASATRSLMNVLETYPRLSNINTAKSVLILHGGMIDSFNCSASNRSNDIPCNHGVGVNLPADYRHVQALLNTDSPNDSFSFVVSQLNISSTTLPYTPSSAASILTYLKSFDAVIFFKHWSSDVTIPLQQAMVQYADEGGGLVALHHGLYNDSISNLLNKNIIRDQLFHAQSSSNTWTGVTLSNYGLYHTNYGHFVSTYGVPPASPQTAPASWSSAPAPTINNGVNFLRTAIYDETYNNMTFIGSPQFGRKPNQIVPIFSNDVSPSTQNHIAGFVKITNPSFDATFGRVAYLQPGERRESFLISHPFAQIVRNTVVWSAVQSIPYVLPIELLSFNVFCQAESMNVRWKVANAVGFSHVEIQTAQDGKNWETVEKVTVPENAVLATEYNATITAGKPYVRLLFVDRDGSTNVSKVAYSNCTDEKQLQKVTVYPNPGRQSINISGIVEGARLVNLTGQVLMYLPAAGTYDISELQPGMYFIYTNKGTVKLIKE